MSEAVDRIRTYHSTGSFGSRQRLQEAQEETRAAYRSLSLDEIEQLVVPAIESKIPGKGGLAEDVLRNLSCLNPGSLTPFHDQLIDRHLYYPGRAFHRATSRTTDRIMEALTAVATMNRLTTNHMLCALAWIGDETVQSTFAFWRSNPPGWTSSLHVPAHEYAQQAGWELTADGTRRDLFLRTCHPLVPPESDSANRDVLKVVVEHEDACRWCDRRMTTMLDLALSKPELDFLGIHGERLRLATCDVCTCYGTVLTTVRFNGWAKWADENTKPSYLPENTGDWPRMQSESLVFSSKPRHWIEGADWCSLAGSSSQVGGHPTWIQDACFPACPECGRLMMFVAQVAVEDIDEHGEGIYYLHLCKSCGRGATHYQQS